MGKEKIGRERKSNQGGDTMLGDKKQGVEEKLIRQGVQWERRKKIINEGVKTQGVDEKVNQEGEKLKTIYREVIKEEPWKNDTGRVEQNKGGRKKYKEGGKKIGRDQSPLYILLLK